MEQLEHKIKNLLSSYQDSYLGISLGEVATIKPTIKKNNKLLVPIEIGFPTRIYAEKLKKELRELLINSTSKNIEIEITTKISTRSVQKGIKPLPQIKNIVAIASGKGGVGKSTTTANLALALEKEGARVGVLDADIYGPSQTRMLGTSGRPESLDGKKMEPIIGHNLQTISIGNLVEEDTPMIWRGPMVTGALEQLLNETNWKDLDYLFIDLPPGTGDIQLTLCQKIPVSGAVIVTTPQDIALLDAQKALKMFEKVNVPVIGIVENMSVHICSQCGNEEYIFGTKGGEKISKKYETPLLGHLPLNREIRESVDNGNPSVLKNPDSSESKTYAKIALTIAAKLSLLKKDFSSRFPKIVVTDS